MSPLLRKLCFLLAASSCLALSAAAAEVAPEAVYCFQVSDFGVSGVTQELTGICITQVPGSEGTVQLGSRILRPGDILTAEQVSRMTFHARSRDGQAEITYLPIYEGRVDGPAVMTVSIGKKENPAPEASDSSLETYKNLENTGTLQVKNPGGGSLRYTVVTEPKRGEVVIHEDGTFTYTPKKNKVGSDSFTYTVTDEAGQVSNPATVSIEILKPLDSAAYRDVSQHQFEAMWMRNTGLYAGEQVAGQDCFGPEEQVSRVDFLAMVMRLLDIQPDAEVSASGFADEADAPEWLRPYLATAMRFGLVSGSREDGKLVFRPNDPITGAEAAQMLQNVLCLPEEAAETSVSAPQWAREAVQAVSSFGLTISAPEQELTRLEAAVLLYQTSKLQETAPGLEVFRQQ